MPSLGHVMNLGVFPLQKCRSKERSPGRSVELVCLPWVSRAETSRGTSHAYLPAKKAAVPQDGGCSRLRSFLQGPIVYSTFTECGKCLVSRFFLSQCRFQQFGRF